MGLHEASVASRILETVEGYAGLRAVYISVGRDSCVQPDMLRDAFDIAKQGSPAGNAALVCVPCPGEDIVVLSVEVENAKDRDKQKRVQPGQAHGRSKP